MRSSDQNRPPGKKGIEERGERCGYYLISPVWIIAPVSFMVLMMIFMYMMFMRGSRGIPSQDFDSEETRRRAVSDTPLGILRRRYSSSEITKEEFDQIKNDLE